MSFKKSKLLKVYLIVAIVEVTAFVMLSILGNIERTGYIEIFDLQQHRSDIFESEDEKVYFYDVRINYYSKTFRSSDIYSVYPKSDNLPEYIKALEWNEEGNPFGTLESSELLSLDKIDIPYTLKVKTENIVLWGLLIFLALSIVVLTFKLKNIFYVLKNNRHEKLPIMHKKILKHEVALPIFLLFSFLFYVLWAAPVSVLAKEFEINNYYIFDNYMIIISFLVSIILAIILVSPYKKTETIVNKYFRSITIGIIYFIVIASTLYNYILPYRYSHLEEGVALSPRVSLLGFGPEYYILDIAIIILSVFLSAVIIRKSIKIIPLILLVFYAFINITTLLSLEVTNDEILSTKPIDSGIRISLNEKNVVLFIFDTTGPFDMLNAIEDLPKEDTEWTKDFMFYDNVVAITRFFTYLSIPSIVGGFNYNPQVQIREIIDNNLTLESERVKNMKYVSIPEYFFISEGLEELEDILDDNIYISFNNISINSFSYDKKEHITGKYLRSPVLALSYYAVMPYFMRSLVVDKHNHKKWNSIFLSDYKWIYVFDNKYLVKFEDTETPTINTILNWGLHGPYTANPIDVTEEEMKTVEGLEEARNQALSFQFRTISDFIDKLKERGVYDRTRILIGSDNGDWSAENTSKLIKNHKGDFIAKEGYAGHTGITSFIMDKDFNSEKNVFAIDSRPLATPDIHSVIVKSFTNKIGYIDYTKSMPPKRIFNIPTIGIGIYRAYLYGGNSPFYEDNDKLKKFLKNVEENDDKISYLKVKSLLPPNYEYLYYPFETIDELPAYEIVEE